MKRAPYNEMKKFNRHFNPPQILVFGFISAIIVGALLLRLPIATNTSITWMDAFFTATASVTVTSLTVVPTMGTFTLFGQIVILLLIQVGGLGIMTFAILIFLIMGRRISFKQRLLVQNALNQNDSGGIIRLVKKLLVFTLALESFAALLLSLYWGPMMGWGKGIYHSIFYAITSFNNSGLSLSAQGLNPWIGDPVVSLVITLLVITGGLGFTVLVNLWDAKHLRDLTLHTKFMLIGTLGLNAFAFIMIFVLEFHNPETLGDLPLGSKLWGSYFQSISTRTAGFHMVDISGMREATMFVLILLMYIGTGSTSVGGGIKVTTFIVLLLSVVNIFRGRRDAVAFGRTIKESIFMRAFAIVVMSLTFIFIAIFILSLTEQASFFNIVFEVVAAFSTTGYATGVTEQLTVIGKIVIVCLMFIGKLGPLTLVFSLAAPESEKIRYPEGKLFIG